MCEQRLQQLVQLMLSQKAGNNFCIVVIGMSGTGKTTFVKRLAATRTNLYTINLDPAVRTVPYQPFLDIRDTHQYKKIMKEYKLGPNGAILTALNLYLSQPEIIVEKMKHIATKHSDQSNTFVIDIPGQIEVFTWSSSSLILTETIATLMPVKIVYIIDSLRCKNPNVFLSNILFAQSIQFRFKKFPFAVLLNKADCSEPATLKLWIQDYQAFLQALKEDSAYISTLSTSIVIHLSDFYSQLKYLPISAKTGAGIEEAMNEVVKL